MRLLIASSNPHKVAEIAAVLGPLGVEAVSLADAAGETPNLPDLADLADLAEPAETAATFAGNADLKARYYAKHAGMLCLADDSGLEVDALDGAPGVYSARYADAGGTRDERDAANNAKLLRALAGVPDAQRTARFVCAMSLAHPHDGVLARARGTFEGRIAREPRGDNGFGYDPLLIVADDPAGRHAAELSPDEKNARSHRGEATRAMAAELQRLGLSTRTG
jgi:XTP/dITP diphosphohydrolase